MAVDQSPPARPAAARAPDSGANREPFAITTDAVNGNGFFDPRYTCDVDNSSPELRWQNPPEGTAGFALLAEDLDTTSGPFAHWVVYGISNAISHLPAGMPAQDMLPNGIRQGINGFGRLGYSGPCPPIGSAPHRYMFRIFALRESPQLPNRVTRELLLSTISPLVIASAQFTGFYRRAVQRAG